MLFNPKKDLILKVAVLDTTKKSLAPCNPRMARVLLRQGKAAVFRRYPFTIILKKEVENPTLPDLKVKIDPGSKTTGVAVVDQGTGEVVFAGEIQHRGQAIVESLKSRKANRRGRRARKTRYRKSRFLNRTRPKGWLPPSLKSRIENTATWVGRLTCAYPISGIAMELVRFDMQLMQSPDIQGVEYQQGELAGYELREYVLIKFDHKCVYGREKSPCDEVLNIDHVDPKSKGGSNRVSNLALSCRKHNEEKGNLSLEQYCKKKDLDPSKIASQIKKPLKDAAAVNSTRWALFGRLKAIGLPVETGSGGMTKFNRAQRNLPKEHWIDAACVGDSTPATLNVEGVNPLKVKATGHGSRQMCNVDKYGFPRTGPKQCRVVHGFKTGDMVNAVVTKGKKIGVYAGRVAVRITGSFAIITGAGKIDGLNWRCFQKLHSGDGYQY